nr:phenylacetate-CoA oxygenase subunit PaaI [Candidatus Dormibacteraeota bacterium]
WAEFVAANAVLDSAFTLMIEALANGNVDVLRSRLKKMLQEERYHSLHGRSWMRELNAGPAIDRAWRQSLEWIGPENTDVDELHRGGQLAQGVVDLRRLLEERLDGAAPPGVFDWGGWEPIRRRTQAGGIDQATLDMLLGLAEKRYMPTSG